LIDARQKFIFALSPQQPEYDAMKTQSFFDQATTVLQRYRARMIQRRDAQRVEGLPDYLLKDIGWPSSKLDVCAGCER
jgi:hypothetical protein